MILRLVFFSFFSKLNLGFSSFDWFRVTRGFIFIFLVSVALFRLGAYGWMVHHEPIQNEHALTVATLVYMPMGVFFLSLTLVSLYRSLGIALSALSHRRYFRHRYKYLVCQLFCSFFVFYYGLVAFSSFDPYSLCFSKGLTVWTQHIHKTFRGRFLWYIPHLCTKWVVKLLSYRLKSFLLVIPALGAFFITIVAKASASQFLSMLFYRGWRLLVVLGSRVTIPMLFCMGLVLFPREWLVRHAQQNALLAVVVTVLISGSFMYYLGHMTSILYQYNHTIHVEYFLGEFSLEPLGRLYRGHSDYLLETFHSGSWWYFACLWNQVTLESAQTVLCYICDLARVTISEGGTIPESIRALALEHYHSHAPHRSWLSGVSFWEQLPRFVLFSPTESIPIGDPSSYSPNMAPQNAVQLTWTDQFGNHHIAKNPQTFEEVLLFKSDFPSYYSKFGTQELSPHFVDALKYQHANNKLVADLNNGRE